MLNFNGVLIEKEKFKFDYSEKVLPFNNALVETIKVKSGSIFYLESHYFRLMASMRMFRLKIPMIFTLEYFEKQILTIINANNYQDDVEVEFLVARNLLISDDSNQIDFLIQTKPIKENPFTSNYEVELFKDFYLNQDKLSNLNFIDSPMQIIAKTFIKDYGYNNVLLLNTAKQVAEAINANVFLIVGNTVITPPLSDGCKNGIVRKKIIEIVKADALLEFKERSISPFEIQKCDELFLTNTIIGVRPVTKFRKKEYKSTLSEKLSKKLEELV